MQDGSWMPHGMCYLWEPWLLGVHVTSDSLVAASYFAIPPALVFLGRRTRKTLDGLGLEQRSLPFVGLLYMFAAFIIACGLTHALGVVTVWNPIYWVSGGAKAATAAISVATAVALPLATPRISELLVSYVRVESQRQELAEKNASLERLADELRAAQQERRSAVQTMAGWLAHDLNNRLQAIQGNTDLLRFDRPEAGERLDDIEREVARCTATIRDLGTLASTPAPVGLEMLDLTGVVRSVLENRTGPVDLQLPGPVIAPAREDVLADILGELIDNARSAVGQHGEIRVEVIPTHPDSTRLAASVVVSNDARGVPARIREMLFDPFVTNRPGRAGIGLAKARRAAIQMGAVLDADFQDDRIEVRLSFVKLEGG